MKTLFTILIFMFLIIGLPQIAPAQRCLSSNLYYIVRDAKGVAIDAARPDLQFVDDKGSRGRWSVHKPGVDQNKTADVPAAMLSLLKSTSTLSTFAYCVFKAPVELRLTLKDKTMDLKFVTPDMPDNQGGIINFLVDGIPFEAGKFEITLAVPNEHGSQYLNYYSARGWKKVN